MSFFKKIFGGKKEKQRERTPKNVVLKAELESEEVYGIDRENAHERALELVPEDFFWDCVDEFAPYGSDEGDIALSEFRKWRKENPNTPTFECLKCTIESVGEIGISDYNKSILDKERIRSEVLNPDFDDTQFISILDISVIATGFGQLIDEGKIDVQNKELIELAIKRQKIWAGFSEISDYQEEYVKKMKVLERVLKEA